MEPKYFIILSMTTKCPNCGNVRVSGEEEAANLISSSEVGCLECDFIGEMPV